MILRPVFAAVLALSAAPAAAISARTPVGVHVPADSAAAAAALQSAQDGDSLVLAAGVHRGPLMVRHAVVLRGDAGAVVDGGGHGTAITVAAPNVVIERLAIRRSGANVMDIDAGVRVVSCAGVVLRDLAISDVLYGINAERATGLRIERCRLTGRVAPLDESGNGNGIHLWYSNGIVVHENQVERFLDAIYLSFANDVDVTANRLQWNGRYGLHTMYSQHDRLRGNVFQLNVAGCALMFSNALDVEHNDFVHNRGSRTYGLLLRDCSDGRFVENRLADNTIAVFMDGSNRNHFRGNLVENNGWGLFIFSSSAGNVFTGNRFVQNDYPVALDMRRTSNRFHDGHTGNYWSENPAFDLDGDGVSDAPHSPVTAFAFLSKQYPDLTILAKSPAVAALGVGERVFPALRPSEAVDSFPLVRPAALAAGVSAVAPDVTTRVAWPAAALFAVLGVGGIAGIARGTGWARRSS